MLPSVTYPGNTWKPRAAITAYQGSPATTMTTSATMMREVKELKLTPEAKWRSELESAPATLAMNRGYAEDQHPGDVGGGAVSVERHRRVGQASEQATQPSALHRHHSNHAEHREDEQHKVEARVGVEVHGPMLMSGRAAGMPARLSPNMGPVSYTICSSRIPNPNAPGPGDPRKTDGRDRDQSADGNRHQP